MSVYYVLDELTVPLEMHSQNINYPPNCPDYLGINRTRWPNYDQRLYTHCSTSTPLYHFRSVFILSYG